MSTFKCPVVLIDNVEKHPDADKLDIVNILGYQCIAGKDEWKKGDWAVFIPPNSVVDVSRPEFKFLEPRAKDGKCRIRTMRLRGIISQGVLLPLPDLPDYIFRLDESMQNVFGVEKYEPLESYHLGGDAVGGIPAHLGGKYSIERFQNYPKIFYAEDYGVYIVTEKLDGTNATAFLKDNHFGVCSHTRELKESDESLYWVVVKKYSIEQKLREGEHTDISIHFEVIGPKIQKNNYQLKQLDMRVFDIRINGQYLNYDDMLSLCKRLDLPTVPEIYRGEMLPREEMVPFSNRESALASAKCEGVIWKPVKEATHLRLGRVQLKIISPEYDLKRG